MIERKAIPIIPALTGVRFLAAFLVFLFHYNPFAGSSSTVSQFFNGIFGQFFVGVSLFFVLSGFLITYNYFDFASFKKNFFRNYMVRRVARIYPLYFTITTLYYIYWWINHLGGHHLIGLYLLNITFLRGLSSKFFFSGIFQGWSLTVEEIFYLLAPLIYLFIRKGYFFTQILAFILLGSSLVMIFRLYPFQGFFSDFPFMFVGTFFGRCTEFFIGIALALAVKSKAVAIQLRGSQFTFLGLIGMALCVMLMSQICREFHVDKSLDHPLGILIQNLVLPFFVSLFLYGLFAERTLVHLFFSSRPMVELGKSSYAFYLIHAGLIANFVTHPFSNLLIRFIILQLLALLLYYAFESPANKFIRKIFSS